MTILTIKYTEVLDLSLSLVVAIMLVDDKDDGLAGNTYPFDINVLHEDFQVLPTNDSYVYLVVHDGPRVSLLSLARKCRDFDWSRAPSSKNQLKKL